MVSIKKKRVLVTGGSGVIGRELVGRLLENGASVMSVDRVPYGGGLSENLNVVEINLDSDDLGPLRIFNPQVIFHLAASFERSTESKEFWATNWRDNVLVSHRVIDLAGRLQKLESFIFASSYLVYSPSLYLRRLPGKDTGYLREKDLKEPRNICGSAKFYTEQELEFMSTVVNPSLRVVSARICRVFGKGSQAVISRWVRKVINGKIINVYNKENRFDFIYAGDVAEGLLKLAEEQKASGPVNLGFGISRSIEDVLIVLRKIMHFDNVQIIDHGRRESFEASCADMSYMRELTAWKGATDLEQGIRKIVEFEREKIG